MTAHYAIADVAALIGEPTRAAILLALLDGSARPAGELARAAGLSAAATSLHLAKLTHARLLVVRQEGRHRYYRLASDGVANALEALGVLAPAPRMSRAISPEKAALRAARTCYDHLAGVLGVALAEKLERERLVRADGPSAYAVTSLGAAWLSEFFAIDVASLAQERRPFARRCLDWTERRPHVAGALGAAMLDRVIAMRWAERRKGTRALVVTNRGRRALGELGLGAAVP